MIRPPLSSMSILQSIINLLHFLPKALQSTSGSQFPASQSSAGGCEEAGIGCSVLKRGLIINMTIPTELSDIYKRVSGDPQLQLRIWNSLSTACESAAGDHRGQAGGLQMVRLFQDELRVAT